jgi:hypothetical protein
MKTKRLNSVARIRERTISTELPQLVGEVSANVLKLEGCHVVSVTDPYGGISRFLDLSRQLFYQVPLQFYPFPKSQEDSEPINYRRVLVSTLLHAFVYDLATFSECISTDCK